MNSEIRRQLRAIGDAFTPAAIEATRGLFAPGALQPADVGAQVLRDVAYGDDVRHRLDIFLSHVTAGGTRPVVVFVHGGGFAAGDKGGEGAPFYNNVGAWAVARGFIGVTVTYRLAPAHRWPAGAQDVAAALRWLRGNVGRHGGDAGRMVVIGQSAGGAHVAGCIAGHGSAGPSTPPVAAAVLISGIHEADAFHPNPMHEVYFGSDRSRYPERSAVLALAATSIPCLLTISEFDPPQFQRQLAAVVAARTAVTGYCPEILWQPGHNHFSTSMQIGGPDDTLGDALAAYVNRICG
jgi:triacylglycerol lipase